jgi:hypothetical protein
MLAPEFAMGLLFSLGLFQRDDLRLRLHQAFLGTLGFQRLEPLFHGLKIVPQPRATNPGGRDRKTTLFQLVGDADLTGLLNGRHTPASSISCEMRFLSTGFLRLISCNARSPPCRKVL